MSATPAGPVDLISVPEPILVRSGATKRDRGHVHRLRPSKPGKPSRTLCGFTADGWTILTDGISRSAGNQLCGRCGSRWGRLPGGAEIVRQIGAGATPDAIARHYGCTVDTVRDAVHRGGLMEFWPYLRRNRLDLGDITILAQAGETAETIAARLGVQRESLRRYLSRHDALHLWRAAA